MQGPFHGSNVDHQCVLSAQWVATSGGATAANILGALTGSQTERKLIKEQICIKLYIAQLRNKKEGEGRVSDWAMQSCVEILCIPMTCVPWVLDL